MEDEIIETDLLIVGAGPAGASLACFLASYGIYLGDFRSFCAR
jgi:flavin-dependent dehydrogenase